LSVFVPGFLLLAEISAVADPRRLTELATQQLNGVSTTLILVLAAGVSYALGLAARTAGFLLAERISKGSSLSWNLPPSAAFDHAAAYFSMRSIVQALEGVPVVRDGQEPTRDSLLPGHFNYAKVWLRTYAPGASVDRHEFEVNVRLALAVAIAPGGLALTRYITEQALNLPWSVVALIAGAAIVASCSLAYFVLRRGIGTRQWERRDGLVNYIAAWHVLRNPPPSSQSPAGTMHPAGEPPEIPES
jgi:hypothetical protein